MEKSDIVDALKEMGTLLQVKGANTFKVRAFENGARALETFSGDLAEVIEEGKLQDIQGIGASLREMIVALYREGKHPDLEELREEIPPGVIEMTRIPGFGPKKAALVYNEKGIDSITALENAINADELSDLRGFGKKTFKNILKGIEHLKQNIGRFRLDEALAAADSVQKYLEAEDAVLAVQAAGSVRRSKETVHDIDVVVSTKKPNDVMDAFVAMDPEAEILGKGETKSSVRMKNGLQVDCRCVSPKQYPHALQHFTGSKEHNIQVRARARKMGLKVSEWGLFDADDEDNEKPIYCKDEAGIYKKLGLEYIPPELREGLDELTWAEDGEVPDLLEEKQIKGLLHCHSTYSDGKNSLEEMARACHDLGMSYLGICDHSQAAFYANGLNPDRVKKQWDEIDELNDKFTEELDGFRILKGIEADILPSGDLDFHDDGDLLDGFELVVASIHGNFNFSKEDQTKRVLSALENPAVTILGHPTGRLLTTRKSYDIDLEEIIEKAVELGVAIEINASPYRLDLDWRWGEQARKHGLHTAICPDAHNVNGLEDFRFGVGIARKAAYAPDHVLNTRSAKDLLKFSNARK